MPFVRLPAGDGSPQLKWWRRRRRGVIADRGPGGQHPAAGPSADHFLTPPALQADVVVARANPPARRLRTVNRVYPQMAPMARWPVGPLARWPVGPDGTVISRNP
jgi:hypothetical protein